MRSTPKTPSDFVSRQRDVLQQAAKFEEFLIGRQGCSHQQHARTTWLLAQQQLSQEAADCEAELQGWLTGSGPAPELLLASTCAAQSAAEAEIEASISCLESLAEDLVPPSAEAGVSIAAALAAAAAVAAVLATPGRDSAVEQLVQQQLQEAEQALTEQLSAAQQVGDTLLSSLQRLVAAGSQVPGTDSSAGLPELVQLLCSQHPLAADGCKTQLLAQAAEAEARHRQQLAERKAAWRAFKASTQQPPAGSTGSQGSLQAPTSARLTQLTYSSCRSTIDGICCPDSSRPSSDGGGWLATDATADGWSATEHAVFVRARCACWAPGGGGAVLLRQLLGLLPARSAAEVQAHERWHKQAARLRSAVAQQEAAWRQEQVAFAAAAAVLLAESQAACLAAGAAVVAQLEAGAACLASAKSLDQQLTARAEEEAGELEQRWQTAVELAEQQAAARHAAADQRERMKQLLAQHRQQQAHQAAADEAARRAAEAAAAKDAAAAAAASRQRVQQRRQVDAAKDARRQRERQRAERAEQRRQAALAQLAQQVAPAVPRDAQRAMAPTASSAAAAAVLERQHGVFASVVGFTTDQVLQDQRFKLYEALRALSLHSTAAGRQAIAAARPPRPLRADILTSEQRRWLEGPA